MATATYQGEINTDRSVTVSRGTGGALSGSNGVAVLFDDTQNWDDVYDALNGVLRGLSRERSKASSPSDVSTSGSSTE